LDGLADERLLFGRDGGEGFFKVHGYNEMGYIV
jgi:hypothetical protein